MALKLAVVLFSIASIAMAQGGGYRGGNPFAGGSPNGDNSANRPSAFSPQASQLASRQKILIAHGVLAALAFVIFFPIGAILIRLASFPGLWLVHALFQTFAYMVYTAAFGIGIWMVRNMPGSLLDRYHPIIGILIFCLLFFQPILGWLHHTKFKKYERRTVWSYGHIWLGRSVITLGMINGGLGLLLARQTHIFGPSRGQIVAYGVVAGIMWLVWMLSALLGERKRTHARRAAGLGKEAASRDTREQVGVA